MAKRSKRDFILNEIKKNEEKIAAYENKIAELKAANEQLAIDAEEAEFTEFRTMIKESGYSMEEIREMLITQMNNKNKEV